MDRPYVNGNGQLAPALEWYIHERERGVYRKREKKNVEGKSNRLFWAPTFSHPLIKKDPTGGRTLHQTARDPQPPPPSVRALPSYWFPWDPPLYKCLITLRALLALSLVCVSQAPALLSAVDIIPSVYAILGQQTLEDGADLVACYLAQHVGRAEGPAIASLIQPDRLRQARH